MTCLNFESHPDKKPTTKEAMAKDTMERTAEPDLNLKSYLADACLHPIFRSFEEQELVEVRVDKHQTHAATPITSVPPLHPITPARHPHLLPNMPIINHLHPNTSIIQTLLPVMSIIQPTHHIKPITTKNLDR